MSEAHVAKFAAMVATDPALIARLGVEQVSDEASARIWVRKAVKEAKAVGLEFTEDEGYAWMQRETTGADELTDAQLEAVAGGVKGSSNNDGMDSNWEKGYGGGSGKPVLYKECVAIRKAFTGW